MNCVPREPIFSRILTHVMRKKFVWPWEPAKINTQGGQTFYNVPWKINGLNRPKETRACTGSATTPPPPLLREVNTPVKEMKSRPKQIPTGRARISIEMANFIPNRAYDFFWREGGQTGLWKKKPRQRLPKGPQKEVKNRKTNSSQVRGKGRPHKEGHLPKPQRNGSLPKEMGY